MFPELTTDFLESETELTDKKINDPQIFKTPKYDFVNKRFVIENGSPVVISGVEAVRQWIVKFIRTTIDTLELYKDTGFGTNKDKLFGKVYFNNGFEESEFERYCKEGFVLCPAIERITNFKMQKEDDKLSVDIMVRMYDGTIIKVLENDITFRV